MKKLLVKLATFVFVLLLTSFRIAASIKFLTEGSAIISFFATPPDRKILGTSHIFFVLCVCLYFLFKILI